MTLKQNELARLAKTIHAAKVAADAAESAKALLKAYALENGVESIAAGGFIITVKQVESKQFDSSRFKSEHKDIYDDYTKVVTSTRINIK